MAEIIDLYTIAGVDIRVLKADSAAGDILDISETAWPLVQLNVTATLGDGWKVLGGGASSSWGAGPGIMLTSAFPINDTTWAVSAKDHLEPSPGSVTAYCVAARIQANVYKRAQGDTAEGPSPLSATADLEDPAFVLVGGGAMVTWADGDPGNLLFASRPEFSGGRWIWRASAKDHLKASAGAITAFAVGLRRDFLDGLGIRVVYVGGTNEYAESFPKASCQIGQPGVFVCGGAETHWIDAYGNPLTEFKPRHDGAAGRNVWLSQAKEHLEPSGAQITAWGVALVPRS